MSPTKVVMLAWQCGLDTDKALKRVQYYKPEVTEQEFYNIWSELERVYDGGGIPSAALYEGKVGLKDRPTYTQDDIDECARVGKTHRLWRHLSHNGKVGLGAQLHKVLNT